MSEKVFQLEEVMTIAKAEHVFHELEDVFREGEPVKIDATQVSRIDTSILQILLAFRLGMKNAGVEVSWGGVSEVFESGARQLGLDQALEL